LNARWVVVAHTIRRTIERERGSFPEPYQRAWRLTALTAAYVWGQLMRSDPDLAPLLLDPPRQGIEDSIGALPLADFVPQYFGRHHQQKTELRGYDDFKVDFKQQRALNDLAAVAVKDWRVSSREAR